MQDWLMRNPKSERALSRVRVIFFDVDGVFTDGKTWQDQTGQWRRAFSVRDTMGVRAIRKAGFRVIVLTPAASPEIRTHFDLIGVDVFRDQCLDSRAVVDQVLAAEGYSLDQAVFVAETASGEIEIRLNGIAIYKTSRQGGDGAVLEICSLMLQQNASQQMSDPVSLIRTTIRTTVGEP